MKYNGVELNCLVSDQILGAQSCKFRRTGRFRVVLTLLPSGAFCLSVAYSFYLPFPHTTYLSDLKLSATLSFRSLTCTFILSSSLLTRLLADKIGSLVLLRTSLEERRSRQDFQRVLHESKTLEGSFFLIDRRANPDAMPWRHQDSNVADPAPTSVRAEDIRRLCDVIDLRPDHLTMLYAVGLTTIWKHPLLVCLNFSSSLWLEVFELIPKKFDHQKVVEYENERKLAAKRKAQAAKDRAVRKRAATKGASHRTKMKKKMAPLSFALPDSEEDGFGTYHSASPLNTIIPNEAKLTTGGGSLILESVNHVEEDTEHRLDNVKDITEAKQSIILICRVRAAGFRLLTELVVIGLRYDTVKDYLPVAKKPIPKIIFKSPILIKGYVLGLANVETWDDIVKKFQLRTPERCANKLKEKRENHLVEIQVDDHDLLVNSDNENDDMLGYESEKYSEDEDADGTNHADDADETNHLDLKLFKMGITRLYKFRREYGKPGRIYRSSNLVDNVRFEEVLVHQRLRKTLIE
nr:hypothetical protein [Tanacetum cinerariifolium]